MDLIEKATIQSHPIFLDKKPFDFTYMKSLLYNIYKNPDCLISEAEKIMAIFEHFKWEFEWDKVNY